MTLISIHRLVLILMFRIDYILCIMLYYNYIVFLDGSFSKSKFHGGVSRHTTRASKTTAMFVLR